MIVALAWTNFDSGQGAICELPGMSAVVYWGDAESAWCWVLDVGDEPTREGDAASIDAAKVAVLAALNQSGWDWPDTDDWERSAG